MWQQKQNNTTAFDELTGLPGEMPMDKNAVWQKIEDRLHIKPRRVKPVWYWVAACAAAVIFFLSVEFGGNNKSGVIADRLALIPISEKPTPAVQKNISPVFKPDQRIKKTEYAAIQIGKPLRAKTGTVLKLIPADADIARIPVIIHPHAAVDLFSNRDTVSFVSASVKKKLNIVNTNELDDADRFAAQRLPKTGGNTTSVNKAAKKEYAGMLNFRIYLKN